MTTETRRGRIEREIHVYTQRERDLGLLDVFDFFRRSLSLSASLLAFLYSPSFCIRICKHGYDVTYKNKKKIEHAHSLETVVERDSVCVHIETNKHTHTHLRCVYFEKKFFKINRRKFLIFFNIFI